MSPRLHHLQKCFWLGRIIRDFLIFWGENIIFVAHCPALPSVCIRWAMGNGQLPTSVAWATIWVEIVAQLGYGWRGCVTSSQPSSVAHSPLPSNASSLLSLKHVVITHWNLSSHPPWTSSNSNFILRLTRVHEKNKWYHKIHGSKCYDQYLQSMKSMNITCL